MPAVNEDSDKNYASARSALAALAPGARLVLAADLLHDLARDQNQMRADLRALQECQKKLQSAEDARAQAEFLVQELQAERDKLGQRLTAEEHENQTLKRLLGDARSAAKDADRALADRDAEIHSLKRDLDVTREKLDSVRAAPSPPAADDQRIQLLQAELAETRQQLQRAARDHEAQIAAKNGQLAELRKQAPAVASAPEVPAWLWERARRCPHLALKEADPPNKATVQRLIDMHDAVYESVHGLEMLVCMTFNRPPPCPNIQPQLQAFQQNSLSSLAGLGNLNPVRMKLRMLEALIKALIVGMDAVLTPKAVMNALREHLHTPGAKWNGFTSLNDYENANGPAHFGDLLAARRVQKIEEVFLGG